MKICLDAGHYGKYNQSPVNKAYYESVQMLKLTMFQKELLEKYEGVEVILTRTDEKDMALFARGQKAKGCKLFLSNHTNAAGSESVDYPVVYGPFDNRGNASDFGLMLSKVIRKTMGTRQEAKVEKRVGSSGKDEYYGVLRGARAAGLSYYYIVEHSFHTNKAATNWMLDDKNLKKLAYAEVEEIARYFGLKKKEEAPTETAKPTVSTETASKFPYRVKIDTDALNVRALPNANKTTKIVTVVKRNEVYTIIEHAKDGKWGKLKSGAGWICLAYTKEI